MLVSRRLLLVLGALTLSGCATLPQQTLSVTDFQKLRIASLTVEGSDVVRSWPAEEEAYLRLHPSPEIESRLSNEPASNFPGVRAHIQAVLTDRFRGEFASQLGPILSGARPVRAIVRLKTFDVPSTARRVFVDNDAKMKATIDLVDARTGAMVVSFDGPFRSRRLIGGLATGIALAIDRSDVGQALITQYVSEYRAWVLGNRGPT